MASITIRNLDDTIKTRLRIQAATHGKSMEDEARDILAAALNREPKRPASMPAHPAEPSSNVPPPTEF